MVRYEAAENIRIFIKSCGVGFFLGAVHCFYNVIFGVRNKNTVRKAVADILFLTAACTVTFIFLLDANNGFFRTFAALGEGTGFLVFFAFTGKSRKKNIRFCRRQSRKSFSQHPKSTVFPP